MSLPPLCNFWVTKIKPLSVRPPCRYEDIIMNVLLSLDLCLVWLYWLCIRFANVLPLLVCSNKYHTVLHCLSFHGVMIASSYLINVYNWPLSLARVLASTSEVLLLVRTAWCPCSHTCKCQCCIGKGSFRWFGVYLYHCLLE